MNELSAPYLLMAVLLPGLIALLLRARVEPRLTGGVVRIVTLIVLGLTIAARLEIRDASDVLVDPWARALGAPILLMDGLSALLLPFVAAMFAFVALVTPRTNRTPGFVRRFLAIEALSVASFACVDPVLLTLLWGGTAFIAWRVLRSTGAQGAARVFAVYMGSSTALLAAGVALGQLAPTVAAVLILIAVAIRKGIFPFHSWSPAFFNHMPLAGAVLFTAPQVGAYVALRVAIPLASDALLWGLGLLALLTTAYAAALAVVQSDARRTFGWVFLSQSALVFAGLDSGSIISLAGGLAIWFSNGLALAGFGMTLAALEARRGKLSLDRHAGGYENTPLLAACFLLLGLSSVGFPGTLGFVGEEALMDGAVGEHPRVGVMVMIATVLNSIVVLRTYFVLFCGQKVPPDPDKRLRWREHLGFVLLAGLLVLGGLYPQPFLAEREAVAEVILSLRGP